MTAFRVYVTVVTMLVTGLHHFFLYKRVGVFFVTFKFPTCYGEFLKLCVLLLYQTFEVPYVRETSHDVHVFWGDPV